MLFTDKDIYVGQSLCRKINIPSPETLKIQNKFTYKIEQKEFSKQPQQTTKKKERKIIAVYYVGALPFISVLPNKYQRIQTNDGTIQRDVMPKS